MLTKGGDQMMTLDYEEDIDYLSHQIILTT